MSFAGKFLHRAEAHLPKVIDAHLHGVLDYLQAAFFLAKAWQWRKSHPHAAVAAALTGSFMLTEALFTDYPLGVAKALPLSAHKRIDMAIAAASLRIPKTFGLEGAPAAIFRSNAVFEATVIGMTDYSSARAREDRARYDYEERRAA